MSLECRTDGCHHEVGRFATGYLAGYCDECREKKIEEMRRIRERGGGEIGGVPVRVAGAAALEPEETEMKTFAEQFGLKKFGRGYIWTREAMIEAVRAYVSEHGEPPTAEDAKRADTGTLPSTKSIVGMFADWNSLIVAAGFLPRTTTGATVRIPADDAPTPDPVSPRVEDGRPDFASHLERHSELVARIQAAESDYALAREALLESYRDYRAFASELGSINDPAE